MDGAVNGFGFSVARCDLEDDRDVVGHAMGCFDHEGVGVLRPVEFLVTAEERDAVDGTVEKHGGGAKGPDAHRGFGRTEDVGVNYRTLPHKADVFGGKGAALAFVE